MEETQLNELYEESVDPIRPIKEPETQVGEIDAHSERTDHADDHGDEEEKPVATFEFHPEATRVTVERISVRTDKIEQVLIAAGRVPLEDTERMMAIHASTKKVAVVCAQESHERPWRPLVQG